VLQRSWEGRPSRPTIAPVIRRGGGEGNCPGFLRASTRRPTHADQRFPSRSRPSKVQPEASSRTPPGRAGAGHPRRRRRPTRRGGGAGSAPSRSGRRCAGCGGPAGGDRLAGRWLPRFPTCGGSCRGAPASIADRARPASSTPWPQEAPVPPGCRCLVLGVHGCDQLLEQAADLSGPVPSAVVGGAAPREVPIGRWSRDSALGRQRDCGWRTGQHGPIRRSGDSLWSFCVVMVAACAAARGCWSVWLCHDAMASAGGAI
jgi:hypothetical protein